MRPPHVICGVCDEEFLFGEGFQLHMRERHGYLQVFSALRGEYRWVPIASHPEHREVNRG